MSMTFLTIDETAQMLKISSRTVRRWIKQGDLPAIKIGKTVRILENDIVKGKPDAPPNRVWQAWAKERAPNAPSLGRVHEISKKVKINVTQLIIDERRGD